MRYGCTKYIQFKPLSRWEPSENYFYPSADDNSSVVPRASKIASSLGLLSPVYVDDVPIERGCKKINKKCCQRKCIIDLII